MKNMNHDNTSYLNFIQDLNNILSDFEISQLGNS